MTTIMNRIALPVALVGVGGLGLLAYAQGVDVRAPGATIQVGPDRGANDGDAGVRVRAPGVDVDVDVDVANAGPTYWIGLLGGDISPELRSHLQLKELKVNQGVIVREVVPESPAAEAGLQNFDILLRANGEPVAGMRELSQLVREVGPTKGQITLEIIRSGRQETVWVTPAERPADAALPRPGLPIPDLRQPGFREDPPLGFRLFGPGGIVGPGGILGDDPNVQIQTNGVSVSVTTVNGETRVKVKRGDEEWDVDANNPEELATLPDDVRVLVDGVLGGAGANVDIDVEEIIPDLQGLFGQFRQRRAGNAALRQQMEAMQRQLDALQRQLRGEPPVAGGDLPAEGGEAPPFEPNVPAPAEVEIPAE